MRYLMLWIQMAFGMHSLISGSNYFLEFLPLPKVSHPVVGPFVDAMTDMGLFGLVKIVETLVGVALICNRFVLLALAAELPTTLTIAWMSVIVVHSDRSVYTGLKEIVFNASLLAWFAGHYAPLLRPRAQGRPLWRERNVLIDALRGRDTETGEA